MNKIQGIYAASLSLFNDDLSLNVERTLNHADFLIDNGCHGVVIFGSTGQSQLVSISEKIKLINSLPKSTNFKKFIVGTGLNSLGDAINLINITLSIGIEYFLVMPPAYYKYKDKDVVKYFEKIINKADKCKIILYNFEKLSGYKFSIECIKQLKKEFPKQIIGIKDSSYNIYSHYKNDNFSIFVGSEEKLLDSLNLGCQGAITATCNVTSSLARKVFEDFHQKKVQTVNKKLCDVRKVFEKYNLISALHSYMAKKEVIFKNLLPILDLLPKKEEKKLFEELEKLDFNIDYL